MTVVATIVVAAVAIGAIGAAAGTAAAQENATDEPEQNATNETTRDLEDAIGQVAGDDEYLQEVDADLRLVEWRYEDGTFRLTFEADRSKRVTMTEAVQFSEGTGQGSIKKDRIPEGTTTVTMDVQQVGGEAAVAITTPQSIREGTFTYVSTGQAAGTTWFDGSARWDFVYLAGLAGAAGTSLGVRRYVVKKRKANEGEPVARRRL